MNLPDSITAASQLGWDQAFFNLSYRLGLRIGWYKKSCFAKIPDGLIPDLNLFNPVDPQELRSIIKENGFNELISTANMISQGQFERFGNGLSPIDLVPPSAEIHWCDLEQNLSRLPTALDIKEIWEPARFTWAPILARAYYLARDEKYLDSFLSFGQRFSTFNPLNYGPNWLSGQEVGIRLINVLIASVLFRSSLTPEDLDWISGLIFTHADRILKTVAYGRSQNNNHYLVESVALLSAARALPDCKKAKKWHKTGLRGVKWCLIHQFHSDGEYVQHSTNYHRLAIQALSWAAIIQPEVKELPQTAGIKRALQWYRERVDEHSGGIPNLGANDGALIFEFDQGGFFDHRGALQLGLAVFNIGKLRSGVWDESLAWLNQQATEADLPPLEEPTILRTPRSWGMVRAIRHTDRPSHADHLHFDLWWKGLNICLDPGTYSYNLPAPWNNELTASVYHNTVSINGADQMRKVSKFLYLDWSDSWVEKSHPDSIFASTNSWEKFHVQHSRQVSVSDGVNWEILDTISKSAAYKNDYAELHWNFPNFTWTLIESEGIYELSFRSPVGKFSVSIRANIAVAGIKLVSGGVLLHGTLPAASTEGWISKTYLRKEPCLSFTIRIPLVTESQFFTQIRLDEI